MTLDPIHIVLGLLALAAAAAAFVFSQRKPPDTAHLAAELQERQREVAGLKAERDELRRRAETAEKAETETRTRLEGEQDRVRGLLQDGVDRTAQIERFREENRTLSMQVAEVAAEAQARNEAIKTMKETFELQSSDALRKVLKDLRSAEDEGRAKREELEREKLSAQLKPVTDTLERFQKHVNELEQKRNEDVGGLKEQIGSLLKASEETRAEAAKLSNALRRGAGVQGRWGEQTLQRVLELAGLRSRFDYEEQTHLEGPEGRLRPDVIVNLAGGGVFVVDAKCSLTAYLEAQDAADDQTREAALARHAASIKAHVAGLSGKTYWDQFKGRRSPDFVAMFVPGDSFLIAALDRMPNLMGEAMDKRVILVTPSTLFALCKAVAYGWRVEEQAQNADLVAKLGKDLYKRLATMGSYVKAMGSSLDDAVEKYNQFIGSLDTQVLTQAKKFEDLKVDHEAKEIPELTAIDNRARTSAKLAVIQADGSGKTLELESPTPLFDVATAATSDSPKRK
jgi:DNA recombination protein RmuC